MNHDIDRKICVTKNASSSEWLLSKLSLITEIFLLAIRFECCHINFEYQLMRISYHYLDEVDCHREINSYMPFKYNDRRLLNCAVRIEQFL